MDRCTALLLVAATAEPTCDPREFCAFTLPVQVIDAASASTTSAELEISVVDYQHNSIDARVDEFCAVNHIEPAHCEQLSTRVWGEVKNRAPLKTCQRMQRTPFDIAPSCTALSICPFFGLTDLELWPIATKLASRDTSVS